MEIIIITILFLAALAFNYFSDVRRDKTEKDRFREFVLANKASNIGDYVQSLPTNEKLEIEQGDEIVDLDQLTPEELLAIRQKELK